MPLLSLFSSKKHQRQQPGAAHLQPPTASRSSSGDSQDYVQVPDAAYLAKPLGQHTEASTSKLRLPFLRKSKLSSTASDAGSDAPAAESGPPLLPPPARTSVFGSLTVSSQSLPLPDAGSPISPGGLLNAATRNAQSERDAHKKRPSVFAWGSSDTGSSSTSKAKTKTKDGDDASFSLRSFTHVAGSRPTSTAVDLASPTATTRPRGDSVYSSSETSSAMKAAEFRARTRRSSTSLPLAASPRNSVDVDSIARSRSPAARTDTPPHARPPRQPGPPSARTASPAGLATPRAPQVRRVRLSSSETSSESEEEEDSDDSDTAPPHVRLARDSTITPRTARSEHAHGSRGLSSERSRPAQGMRPSARSEAGHGSSSSVNLIRHPNQQHQPPPVAGSVYSRPRASVSTSALASTPTSTTNTMRPPLPTSVGASASSKKGKARNAGSDTSEDESEHHDSDSDDLPLAAPPRRPGSSLSMASTGSSPARRHAALPGKPLIDLNAPSTLNAPPPLPANLRKFERTSTDPGRMSVSVSSPAAAPRFFSSTETPTLKLADKPPPPVPTRVATRESNSGFAVLSRPPRQSSLPTSAPPTSTTHQLAQQQKQQQQQQQQSPKRPVSSVLPRPPSGILKTPSPPGTLPGGDSSRSGSPARHTGSSSPARQSYLSPSVPRPAFVRGESPASSTSASSRTQPVTPRDGSELGGSRRYDSAGNSVVTDSSGTGEKPRRLDAHGRRFSVSFEEPAERERGRSSAAISSPVAKKGESRRKENVSSEDAQMERRRNEAKAAIELGNAIHGPTPVVDDDDAPVGMNPQAAMGMGMNFNPAMYPPGAFAFPNGQGFPNQPMFAPGIALTPNFLMPQMPQMGPGVDPAFLAAHQQAMLAAKQAYQIAVAQQALAAAGDEWERSSNAGGWQMGMPMGMPAMGMMPQMMYPAAPASVYGGGSPGSVYGGSPGRPQMWSGTGSVYGEAFGPSTTSAADRRRSSAPMQPTVPFPASSSAGNLDGHHRQQQQQQQSGSGPMQPTVPFPASSSAGNLDGHHRQQQQQQQSGSGQPRQRTRTAPSSAPAPLLSPSSLFPNAPRTPPSSWRTSAHMS